MNQQLRKTFGTDSGMLAIWDPHHFPNVVDYETWEAQLLEDVDIAKHIDAGAFVPLYIYSDGAFECDLRVGTTNAPAVLTERENKNLVVRSEPYLFRSTGRLCISGIEYIERKPGSSVGILPLEAAEWSVTVHLIDWPAEPGARSADGKPSATALPDFVVLVNPANDRVSSYRKKIATFEKPRRKDSGLRLEDMRAASIRAASNVLTPLVGVAPLQKELPHLLDARRVGQ